MRWLQERAESCVTLPRGHDQRVDRTATQLTRGRSVGLYDRSMAPEVPFRRSCSGGAQPGGHDYFFVCGAAQKAARVDLGHTCNEYHRSSKNHAVAVSTASGSAVFEEGLAASADTHGMIGIREVQDPAFFIGLRMFACVGT